MKRLSLVVTVMLLWVSFIMAANNALTFDGSDDFVYNPTSLKGVVANTFTYEFWAYPTAEIGVDAETTEGVYGAWNQHYVACIENGGSDGYAGAGVSVGTNGVGVYEHASYYLPALLFWEGTLSGWTHIAVVYNNKQPSLYINGVLVHTGLTSTKDYVFPSLCLGGDYGTFAGQVDEFRVWSDVRTETEIRQNMYRELPDPASEANLVGYYKFNETEDVYLTENQSGDECQLWNMNGDEWTTSPAMFGPKYCLDFDGSNDYVNIASEPLYTGSNITAFTEEAWIYSGNTDSDYHGVIGSQYSKTEDRGPSVYVYNVTDIHFGFGDGSTWYSHTVEDVIEANTWAHIAVTYDGTNYSLYVNGILEFTSTDDAGHYPTRGITYIGKVNAYFGGKIDEVRIWNTARTATQIRESICKTLTGNESGLVAYYSFDNKAGTTLQNISGNIYDGTLTDMDGTTDWVTSSAFNTWLNTSSSDWSTATNWSTGSVPGSSDNVGIYGWSSGSEASISGSPTVSNMVISSTSSPTFSSGITVNGSLLLEKDMDLNGQIITLGSSATLVEDAGAFSGTSGSITTTRDLSNIDEDVAGLGAEITTSANMGSTTITRTHAQASGNISSSILRRYAITPSTNTGLDATLAFHYLDSELNSLKEANFQLLKSTDGTTWSEKGGTVSTGDNTITLSGIDDFSNWTVNAYNQPTNNTALDFDGTDDYVSTNYTTQLDSWTVECWVKGDYAPTSGFSRVIFRGTNFQINWNHDDQNYRGSIALEDGADGYATGWCSASFGTLEAGTWYHLAGTYDGNDLKAYKNGQLITNNGWPDGYATSTSQQLMLGSAGSEQYFDGDIDEVRIWNDVRTATEIRENMCRTLDGDESGLVVYYRLNEASENTAYDATGNGYNGTITGSAGWTDSEAFNTWLGGTSGDWSTASNWTDGVPTSSDNVGIYKWDDNNEVTISGTPEVNDMVISSTSTPALSSGITVNGSLILEKDIDLNGKTVTLGSTATLIEDAGVFSGTSGSITTTRDLSNIDEDVAGLGASITEDGDLGSTTIIRGHTAQGSSGIKRYYRITPTNNPSGASLVFHYDDSELNGLTESTLALFKSEDGSTWTEQSSTLDTDNNTLTLSGINSFSYWTAGPTGSDVSLPVELTDFTVKTSGNSVILAWHTESETENLGFIIERRTVGANHDSPSEWSQIVSYTTTDALAGHGSTSEAHEYAWTDAAVVPGETYAYRLADVDYSGKATWHSAAEVTVPESGSGVPTEFGLRKAYPNPFNPAVTLSYGLTADARTSLKVYNMLGQEVATMVNAYQNAGNYTFTWQPQNLSAGIYLVKLESGKMTNLQKVVFVK